MRITHTRSPISFFTTALRGKRHPYSPFTKQDRGPEEPGACLGSHRGVDAGTREVMAAVPSAGHPPRTHTCLTAQPTPTNTEAVHCGTSAYLTRRVAVGNKGRLPRRNGAAQSPARFQDQEYCCWVEDKRRAAPGGAPMRTALLRLLRFTEKSCQ